MRQSWKALLVAAVVVLATFSAVTLASASTDRTSVLHLTIKNETETFLDLGKKGPSQGDQLILAADVWMSGKQVGTVGAVTTVTRAAAPEEIHIVATFSLPKGQITGQGLLIGTATDTLAITGGTGKYRDAGGYSQGTQSDQVTLFVDNLAT
jgi:type IV pilus biogenesis protein CpaD/CtpE